MSPATHAPTWTPPAGRGAPSGVHSPRAATGRRGSGRFAAVRAWPLVHDFQPGETDELGRAMFWLCRRYLEVEHGDAHRPTPVERTQQAERAALICLIDIAFERPPAEALAELLAMGEATVKRRRRLYETAKRMELMARDGAR